MRRREFITLLCALPLAACFEEPKGPVEVKWDRDACEFCRMILSDPRFAAQIRGGEKRKVYKFDDLGDAVLWLEKQSWKADPATEIWVAEMGSTREKMKWLDARQAWFVANHKTPMDHGFGAKSERTEGAVSFTEMRKKVLERGAPNICEPEETEKRHSH